MPWKATFLNDTDSPDIGTAIAIFDDGVSAPFTFSGRVDQKNDLSSFIDKAKVALSERQSKISTANSIALKIEGALNS